MLPAPTAPSEGYAGVRNLVRKSEDLPTRSRSWLTSSGVASYRTTLSEEKPIDLLDCAARGFAGLSLVRPGWNRSPAQNHPMFHGPSWETLYRVPLCSPDPTRRPGSRVARQEDFSSGASYRPTPKKTRKLFSLPAGGDRFFNPFLTLLAVAGFPRETGASAPITLATCTLLPSRKSEKCGLKPVDNGDIGNK